MASLITASDRQWMHALFDFVETDYGASGAERLLIALRDRAASGDDVVHMAFGVAASDIDGGFQAFIKMRVNQK